MIVFTVSQDLAACHVNEGVSATCPAELNLVRGGSWGLKRHGILKLDLLSFDLVVATPGFNRRSAAITEAAVAGRVKAIATITTSCPLAKQVRPRQARSDT